jgi:hypothetical protein
MDDTGRITGIFDNPESAIFRGETAIFGRSSRQSEGAGEDVSNVAGTRFEMAF